MKLKIFTDGGSRGNPGEAAIGIVILNNENGKKIAEISKCIGRTTNNVAEYTAILIALEWIEREKKNAQLDFYMDSELVAKQLSGEYKVKDAKLKLIFSAIQAKIIKLGGISNFTHVKREKNWEADALVNEALDKKCRAKD